MCKVYYTDVHQNDIVWYCFYIYVVPGFLVAGQWYWHVNWEKEKSKENCFAIQAKSAVAIYNMTPVTKDFKATYVNF